MTIPHSKDLSSHQMKVTEEKKEEIPLPASGPHQDTTKEYNFEDKVQQLQFEFIIKFIYYYLSKKQ